VRFCEGTWAPTMPKIEDSDHYSMQFGQKAPPTRAMRPRFERENLVFARARLGLSLAISAAPQHAYSTAATQGSGNRTSEFLFFIVISAPYDTFNARVLHVKENRLRFFNDYGDLIFRIGQLTVRVKLTSPKALLVAVVLQCRHVGSKNMPT